MNNYESLVSEIQSEAKRVGEDNRKLRKIITEENVIGSSKQPHEPIDKFRNDYVEVADKIFYNLRNQNHNLAKVVSSINHLVGLHLFPILLQEKEMYENLWKNTAAVLEEQVPIQSLSQVAFKNSVHDKIMQVSL